MTNSHATQSGILQNTATKTKLNNILLLYTGRLHSIDYSLFFLFSYFDWTNRLHKYHYTINRGETVSQCWWQSITAIKATQQRPKLETTYQLWQSTLEHRSGSSLSLTTPWLLAGLLAARSGTKTQILNNTMLLRWWRGTCNFEASLHRTPTNCPLFWLPRRNTKITGTRKKKEGTRRGTYSTRPSSTTFKILTPDRDVESSDDGLMPPTAYHCSFESFTNLRRSRASFTHPHTSATTWERDVVSTWLHGSKTALCVILSELAADSTNMAIPESEKKFRWLKCGLPTKSCTQRMARCTSSSQIITRSKLVMNRPPQDTGPRTIRAVSWKSWKTRSGFFQHNNHVTLPHWSQYIL